MIIGGSVPKDISAYYAASPQTIEGLKAKLKNNNFEILSIEEILKGKTVVTITNEELKHTNTFVATLQILLNGTDEIRVQNPSYFGAAYLKSKFKYGQFKSTLASLQKVLGDMHIVSDKTEYSKLKEYNLMFGMSHIEDMIDLAMGSKLTDKLVGKNTDKNIAYSLKLPDGSILVGHKLKFIDNKFLNKIHAENNAQILPYESMIKDNKAYMMDPKFYLSLSLPLLTITDFMKISTVPDVIEKNLRSFYK
jgi:hypothetical protein